MPGDPVTRFADLARTVCRELEADPPGAADLLRRLAELVVAALDLPEVEGSDEERPTPDHLADEERVREGVARRLGEAAGFWEVFDPTERAEASPSSVSGDVGDLYGDLKAGLHLFDAGHLVDAAWEWRFRFAVHWGRHATDAMRPLQRIAAREWLDSV